MTTRPLVRLAQRLLPAQLHPIGAGIYWLGSKHFCPICRWPARAFRPLEVNTTCAERCSRCGSLARHRLIWLFLQSRTNLFTAPLEVLHFSPEACLSERLRRQPNLNYTTADVDGGYVPWMETLDLMQIAKPDNSYDAVLCIHVLQAVEDDQRAMAELFRVLKPGGWAILNSRMNTEAEHTQPNPDLPPPEVRARAGHRDFAFRIYGQDFAARLEGAGFEVEVIPFREELGPEAMERYYLHTPPDIYLCRKPVA